MLWMCGALVKLSCFFSLPLYNKLVGESGGHLVCV